MSLSARAARPACVAVSFDPRLVEETVLLAEPLLGRAETLLQWLYLGATSPIEEGADLVGDGRTVRASWPVLVIRIRPETLLNPERLLGLMRHELRRLAAGFRSLRETRDIDPDAAREEGTLKASRPAHAPMRVPHSPAVASGHCPLCRFPHPALRTAVAGMNAASISAIRADFPRWSPEAGLCLQCAELYTSFPTATAV